MTVLKTSLIRDIRTRVAGVVVGQDIVVERILIALLTGGHLLLEAGSTRHKTFKNNELGLRN